MSLINLPWEAHVTVATVVEQNGQFLLVEEKPKAQSYLVLNQPAGHVEQGETLVEAAVRETLEETGYLVQVQHLIGIYTYVPPDAGHKTYFRFCFKAHIVSFDAHRELDPVINQTAWYTLNDIKMATNLRSPLVLQCVLDDIAQKKYPLDVIFNAN